MDICLFEWGIFIAYNVRYNTKSMYYLRDDDMTTYNVCDDFAGKGDSARILHPD